MSLSLPSLMLLELNAARPRRRTIGLTPLIDVVFILLLFFMLASNFQQWRSLNITAPGPGDGAPGESQVLLLRVHADGALELSGQRLSFEALTRRLNTYLAADPEQAVIVQPTPEVELQLLVRTFDRLSAAGVRELTLGGL